MGAGAGAVLLPEPLERERQERGAHPLAVVLDAEPGLMVDPVQADPHVASGWSELDGVRQQVGHGLLQSAGVSPHPERRLPRRPGQGQALEGCVARYGIDGGLDHAAQVHELRVEHEPARRDPRRVEQVLDDALQGACAALDDLERALPPGGIESTLAQQAEPHQYRSERRAQLVGEQRQELVLEMARRLGAMPRALLPHVTERVSRNRTGRGDGGLLPGSRSGCC